MYNWDMKNNIYMGAPDQAHGRFGNSNKYLDNKKKFIFAIKQN